MERCDACGFERPAYNSCGNRHCPVCQGKLARKWLAARLDELLNTAYFHCVFTIPDVFNVLVDYNARTVYGILFRAASGTLKHFARTKLHGQLGAIGILHTWGQTMWLHPHVHFVVTGGALSDDRRRWRSTGPDFLFDVYEMSRDFRDRFCALLRKAELVFAGDAAPLADAERFDAFIGEQEKRDWVVYSKKPFAGPRQVVEYISRYTHRVAISNRRILDVSEHGEVTFEYKDYRNKELPEVKQMRLSAVDFIGRFLRHVLPRGFRKIRFYGILAGREKQAKLAAARALLGAPADELEPACCCEVTDLDALRCPQCGEGTMQRIAPIARERPPPVVMRWNRPTHSQAA